MEPHDIQYMLGQIDGKLDSIKARLDSAERVEPRVRKLETSNARTHGALGLLGLIVGALGFDRMSRLLH